MPTAIVQFPDDPQFCHAGMVAARTGILLLTMAIVVGCSSQNNAQTDNKSTSQNSEVSTASPPVDEKSEVGGSSSVGDSEKTTSSVTFRDIAEERGLRFELPEQPRPMTALHAFGSGCAAFDYNSDGWQDVLLVSDPHPRLFRNIEGRSFDEVTVSSGLGSFSGDWMGCATGDYNGDGLLDVLLTGYHCLALYKNLGGSQFELVTAAAGLAPDNSGHWGASAGFMDLDGDGWLDLVILNYVVFGPESKQYCEHRPGLISGCNPRVTYPPEWGEIWRNTGLGSFELVPPSQGMEATHGMGLVLAFTDIDNDGKMDFYIGNDGTPAELMHNKGDMRFENISKWAGVSEADRGVAAAMGADWSDFDRDGIQDLLITDWEGKGASLFQGMGSMVFLCRSQMTGLSHHTFNRMGFGTKWVDFENDGWPDIFSVNGHVYDNSADINGPESPFRQSISLLSNRFGRRFDDALTNLSKDVQRAMVGRGAATIDFDNDGRVDLLGVDFEGPVMLLHNETEVNHHWITLNLRGHAPNCFAYGAYVTGKAGDRVWSSFVSPTSSYLSSSDMRIHWGLGDSSGLDEITVHWPSGTEQTLKNVVADQILHVSEIMNGN